MKKRNKIANKIGLAVLTAGICWQSLPVTNAYAETALNDEADLHIAGRAVNNASEQATMSNASVQNMTPQNELLPENILQKSAPIFEHVRISKEKMRELINSMDTPESLESEAYHLNNRDIVMKLGEKVKLSLVTASGETVEDVQWFCETTYPQTAIYDAGEDMAEGTVISLDTDGNITAVYAKAGDINDAEVWAYYAGTAYRCHIEVLSAERVEIIQKEKLLEEKADKIVADMMDLSDFEKVKTAHDWIVKNIRYIKGYGEHTAYNGIIEGTAVCSGYSQSYKYLLDKLGINSRLVVGRVSSGELHMWNLVELDGKWYHVDTTWDDDIYDGEVKYDYFLIHDEDFKGSRQGYWNPYKDQMGGRYRYYIYDREGILGETADEIRDVIERQYSSYGKDIRVGKMRILTSEYFSKDFIDKSIIAVTGADISSYKSSRYRGYILHEYLVSIGEPGNAENITVNELKAEQLGDSDRVSPVYIKLDKAVNLTLGNISVKNASAVGLEKLADDAYRLKLDKPNFSKNGTVEVSIRKRGYSFVINENKVNVVSNVAPVPEAVFVPTKDISGVLKNVKPGMQYSTNGNDWVDITSEEVALDNIGSAKIFVRYPSSEGRLKSSAQTIKISMMPDPRYVKAKNGRIVGVNTNMEYRKSGDQFWTDCTGKTIAGLEDGVYQVRYRITGDKLASNAVEVTVTHTDAVSEDKPYTDGYGSEEGTAPNHDSGRQENAVVQDDGKEKNETGKNAEQVPENSSKPDNADGTVTGKYDNNSRTENTGSVSDTNPANHSGSGQEKNSRTHGGGSGSKGGGSSRSRSGGGSGSGGGSSRSRSGGGSGSGGGGSHSRSTGISGAQKSSGVSDALGVWKADSNGWWYTLSDGSYVREAWRSINGAGGSKWYYFGKDGYMATGWILQDGKWYYLDKSEGRMYQNEKTPDGYWVGADGAWIK